MDLLLVPDSHIFSPVVKINRSVSTLNFQFQTGGVFIWSQTNRIWLSVKYNKTWCFVLQVKCWDLEQNKVVRHYHGHLSACHAIDIHPTLDIIMTCGRDATVRVSIIHLQAMHSVHLFLMDTSAILTWSVFITHFLQVWDMRTKACIHTMTGHTNTVADVKCQGVEPQV